LIGDAALFSRLKYPIRKAKNQKREPNLMAFKIKSAIQDFIAVPKLGQPTVKSL
jgi:hypothetical protein